MQPEYRQASNLTFGCTLRLLPREAGREEGADLRLLFTVDESCYDAVVRYHIKRNVT